MKNLFWGLTLLLFCACGSKKNSNEKPGGESLEKRLEAFLRANERLDFEGVMDYTYPRIFTIASRKDLIAALENGFNSEEMKVTLDSVRALKIHPVFEMEGGSYAKIDYSMLMLMDLKEDPDKEGESDDESQAEFMQTMMEEQFGKGNVSIDSATGNIRIRMKSEMAALKDKHSKDWTFINFKDDDQDLLDKLLSKELQQKLKSYQ